MIFSGGRRVAAVAPMNHGGATVGLGWLRDGGADIFPLGMSFPLGTKTLADRGSDDPAGAAAGTPPPRTSLRDG